MSLRGQSLHFPLDFNVYFSVFEFLALNFEMKLSFGLIESIVLLNFTMKLNIFQYSFFLNVPSLNIRCHSLPLGYSNCSTAIFFNCVL